MSGVKGNPGYNYEYKEQNKEQPIVTPEPSCEVTEVLPRPTCGISEVEEVTEIEQVTEVEQVTPQPPAPLPVKPQPQPQTIVPEQPTTTQEKRGVKK